MSKRTIEVSEETYNLIKDQLSKDEQIDISELNDLVGKKFFFRTVTYHMIGKVEKLIGKFVVLSKASWVADSGRFMQAILEGDIKEYEHVDVAYVNLETVTDFFPWLHELPEGQK